ncbi:hypothetical protein HCN44_007889 [Aphidius gifuensis]|uniref:Uncharacterized protein n=1 Tax=Aphidius gifuensis TaxID=684658 RepID=A0A834XV54_APHGI|nr:hypothetical protein HCN44_007889 [Aphidius gifuensis]
MTNFCSVKILKSTEIKNLEDYQSFESISPISDDEKVELLSETDFDGTLYKVDNTGDDDPAARLEQAELEQRLSGEPTVPVADNPDNTGDDDPAARLEQEELEQRLSGEPIVPVADNPDNTGDESNGSAMDHEKSNFAAKKKDI